MCRADRLAFPIRDGVPIMLEGEARQLPAGGSTSTPLDTDFNEDSQAKKAGPDARS